MVPSAYKSPYHNGRRLGGPPQVSRPSFSNHPSDFTDDTRGYFSQSWDFCFVSFPFLVLFLVLWVNVEIFFLPNLVLFFHHLITFPSFLWRVHLFPSMRDIPKTNKTIKIVPSTNRDYPSRSQRKKRFEFQVQMQLFPPDHLNMYILYVI